MWNFIIKLSLLYFVASILVHVIIGCCWPFHTYLPCFTETQGLWITCLSTTELIPSGSSRLCPCPPQAFLLGESMEKTCLTGLQRDRTSWPGGQMACSTWGQSPRLVWGETLLLAVWVFYQCTATYSSTPDTQISDAQTSACFWHVAQWNSTLSGSYILQFLNFFCHFIWPTFTKMDVTQTLWSHNLVVLH